MTIVHKHTNINYGKQPMADSLREGDDAAAAVAKTINRVSLDSMLAKVTHTDYQVLNRHPHITLCVLTLENGFVLVGKSAPADPLNYDAKLGEKFARDDAIRQMWPLEAYLLREKMTKKD